MRHAGCVALLAGLSLASGCVQWDAPRPDTSVAAAPAVPAVQQAPATAPRVDERATPVADLADTMREDPDPVERREAVYAIADAGGPDPAATLGQALTDPDADVRAAAVEAMTGIDDGTVADWLSIGLGDPDPGVRRSAVEALGQVGGSSAKFLLEQALADTDAGVRGAAQQMLEEPEFAAGSVR